MVKKYATRARKAKDAKIAKKPRKRKSQKFLKRTVPYRDLYRDGVTYSFLAQFLNCREQARLSYVEGLRTEGMSVPLDFGIAFHECLEWTASGKSVTTIGRKLGKLAQTKAKIKLRADERATYQRLLRTVAAVYPLYHDYWSGRDHKKKYIYEEESFQFPYTSARGQTIPIRGRLDEAYIDEDGAVVLQENKTKGMIDEEAIRLMLSHDMQTMLYCYALRNLTGKEPTRILYNVIRRSAQRFTGSYRSKPETESQFIARIQDDVVARPQHYFMRWRVDLHKGDLDNWLSRVFDPLLDQVIRWWESIRKDPFNPWDSQEHFLNPEGLITKYGRSDFFSLITRGSYEGLELRR